MAPPATSPPRTSGRASVLLLADDHRGHANTVLDQLRALQSESRHSVYLLNPSWRRSFPFLDLAEFDAIVIHWTLTVTKTRDFPQALAERVAAFRGPKILMIQDDYRWVHKVHAAIRSLGICTVFTLVPEHESAKVWPPHLLPGVRIVTYLAGYVPEALLTRSVPPLAERTLDLAYRGRELPFWLGRLAQEKVAIARGAKKRAAAAGLIVDVESREGDRIYGDAWIRFLSSARATLGTESGASITDFDGSVESAVREYLALHPTADFEEVHREVLAPFEGNVLLNVISPRMFEAIALRTGLVLFPGTYSNVLEAGRHYIPLEKDFSNFQDVARQLRDDVSLGTMIRRAYDEVGLRHEYSHQAFAALLDEELESAPGFRARGRPQVRWRAEKALGRVPHRVLDQVSRDLRRLAGSFRSLARNADLARGILANRRRLPAWTHLLADVIRVDLLRRAARGEAVGDRPFSLAVAPVSDAAVAVVTSQPGPPRPLSAAEAAAVRSAPRVLWNHMRVGTHIEAREWPLSGDLLSIGEHGIYTFEALHRVGLQGAILAPERPTSRGGAEAPTSRGGAAE